MKLNELKPVEGARHYKKRVGRGTGSGLGKTSTRGHKGQNARSGGGVRPGFEGGQTPLFKRLPKRGFTNINRLEYAVVNVSDLNTFEAGSVVDLQALQQKGLVKKEYEGVKVLGNGELKVALTVKAKKFSETAKEKISANNFYVDIEDVKNLDDKEIIALSNAQAWNPETDEYTSIAKIEYELQEAVGHYPVKFFTAGGTCIERNIFVVNQPLIYSLYH